MLKRIAVSEVQLGMFIQELQGTTWLNHPFWKTQFVLHDEADLHRLQLSAVTHVLIDTQRGADVPAAADAAPPPARAEAEVAAAPLPEPVSLAQEMAAASELKQRAKQQIASLFEDLRLGQAVNPQLVAPLVDDITASVHRNPDAFVSLSRLRNQDDYTYLHSVTVCALMISLGGQLGLRGEALHEAGMAGLLHDVGKARVPLEILNKPGKLTPEEFEAIKAHARLGYDMLVHSGGASSAAQDVALHHHERMDGKGYPDGLSGEGISLLSRMGAVCDVYDAITSNRPYKRGWEPAESIRLMATWTQEGQFDLRVFQAFVKALGIYPTGSLVRLQSGYLAVVLDQTKGSALKPRVKLFYRAEGRRRVTPQLVNLSDADCTDKIVAREQPEDWGLTTDDITLLWAG